MTPSAQSGLPDPDEALMDNRWLDDIKKARRAYTDAGGDGAAYMSAVEMVTDLVQRGTACAAEAQQDGIGCRATLAGICVQLADEIVH